MNTKKRVIYKVLLNILFNMSKSKSDKDLFRGLMRESRKVNNNFSDFMKLTFYLT